MTLKSSILFEEAGQGELFTKVSPRVFQEESLEKLTGNSWSQVAFANESASAGRGQHLSSACR